MQVIIGMAVEMRKIIVAEMAEMLILAFNKESSCHQRQADVGHTEGSRIGQPVDEPLLGREAVHIGKLQRLAGSLFGNAPGDPASPHFHVV